MEQKKSVAAKVLGILAVVFGAISIIPFLNFVFVWPALILGLIGLILSTIEKPVRGGVLSLNIVGLGLALLSLLIYIF